MNSKRHLLLRDGRGAAERHGFLALLVMLFIAFFGLLAGVQSLVLIGISGVGRAYDVGLERDLIAGQLQMVLEESVLQQWEGRHEAMPDFGSDLAARSSRVGMPDITLSPEGAIASPVLPPDFLEGGRPLAYETPSGSLLSRCGPGLRALCGPFVAETPATPVAFRAAGLPWPGSSEESLKFEYTILRVPLLGLGVLGYDLPDELGCAVAGASAPTVAGGLARARDAARRDDLMGSGAGLPYQFRRRATLAAAFAWLFSKGFVSSAAHQAGVGLLHRLDLPSESTALCEGLVRTVDGASLDLGLAGRGSFGGVDSSGSLLLVASSSPHQVLRLFDSGSVSSQPLVLLVVGTGGLQLQVGDCQRQVLLIASGVELVPCGGAWSGGIILGPRCRVLPGAGQVALSHLSYYAGDGTGAEDWFKVRLVPDVRLAALSPSVVFVGTRYLSNEL